MYSQKQHYAIQQGNARIAALKDLDVPLRWDSQWGSPWSSELTRKDRYLRLTLSCLHCGATSTRWMTIRPRGRNRYESRMKKHEARTMLEFVFLCDHDVRKKYLKALADAAFETRVHAHLLQEGNAKRP